MTKKHLVSFDRRFQIWQYSVSHAQLLLRSTKNESHALQVDVLFKNVAAIQLPALFVGLTISELGEEDFLSENLSLGLSSTQGRRYFHLEGDNWHGVVVAGHVSWLEDEAEHSADSKLFSM